MNELIKKYEMLKTTEEKRRFVLSIITDEKFIKCLQFKAISKSTIDIAFRKHTGQEIIIKENYYTTKKR